MILPRDANQLLLPVNPQFLWGSLIVALALNFIPLGRSVAVPDFLAVTLVFWNVHQPRKVGIGVAFGFGILIDVHEGALLGQHALAYTLLSYFAVSMHRRLLWFSVLGQALQLYPLFMAAHGVSFVIRIFLGGMLPGWQLLLAPLFEVWLWPLVTWLLLAPQRRAPDPDENRPI